MTFPKGWAEAGGKALAETERSGALLGNDGGRYRPTDYRPRSLTPTKERLESSHRASAKGRRSQSLARKLDQLLGTEEEL